MTHSHVWNKDMIKEYEAQQEKYVRLVGRYHTRILSHEIENFNSLNINKKKSYVILNSNEKVLKKFMLAYILKFYSNIRDYDNKFENISFKTHCDIITKKEGSINTPDGKILIFHYERLYCTSGWYGKYNFEKIAAEISKRRREGQVSIILAEKKLIAPIKDSNKKLNLVEYLGDEVVTIYLNDDLSLGEKLKVDIVESDSTSPYKDNKSDDSKDNSNNTINLRLNK